MGKLYNRLQDMNKKKKYLKMIIFIQENILKK